ncbi:glycosyl hydrolase [Halorubrum saccharovorum]|uniref:Glycosyl hydrolase n=1 Tax=Halorubrum saccharovorum TaxID=2248 RepID=A0A0F8CJD5_9EURY|nr:MULTISPECIES: ThuA domain-containing protein [Halorubrum]KKF39047.1 glycosyl hydrolase [Halorubrum saccharovorum]
MAPRSVLAIGGNRFPFHRFEARGPEISAVFDDQITLKLTTDKDDLVDLSGYDVIVDYLTDSSLTDEQLQGLLSFVEDGGGYVGIHCASDLTSTEPDDPDDVIDSHDNPFPELRELIGGHFITHPEQAALDIHIVDHHHPVTAAMDHLTVWDEPYVVDVDDTVRVLARMDHPEHADTPVVWTKSYGDGRVFYSSLGHSTPSLTHEGVQRLIREGTRWAAGDD